MLVHNSCREKQNHLLRLMKLHIKFSKIHIKSEKKIRAYETLHAHIFFVPNKSFLAKNICIEKFTIDWSRLSWFELAFLSIWYLKRIRLHAFFIRTSRLRYGPNILFISTNIRIGIYLTVSNESLHHGCNLKQSLKGYEGRNLIITRWKLRTIEARRKKTLFLQKKSV